MDNHGYNFLRLFDILPNFSFAKSETAWLLVIMVLWVAWVAERLKLGS